jgi:hypothetical protein
MQGNDANATKLKDMNTKFEHLEEVYDAVSGAVVASNFDEKARFVATDEDADLVAVYVWDATECGLHELDEVIDTDEKRYATRILGLDAAVVSHIYTWMDGVQYYICFEDDYNYDDED